MLYWQPVAEANELQVTHDSNVESGIASGGQNNINIDQCELINGRICRDKLLMRAGLNGGGHRLLEYLVKCLLSS